MGTIKECSVKSISSVLTCTSSIVLLLQTLIRTMMKITLGLACIAVVLALMHVQPSSAQESQGPDLDQELEMEKAEIADQQLNNKVVGHVAGGRCVSRD